MECVVAITLIDDTIRLEEYAKPVTGLACVVQFDGLNDLVIEVQAPVVATQLRLNTSLSLISQLFNRLQAPSPTIPVENSKPQDVLFSGGKTREKRPGVSSDGMPVSLGGLAGPLAFR
ncbi:hypothetical protein HYQ46_013158 [Verticillium longisporum]|nr:hypothetical protein HYQ46_013158 [Verticillium longisporum]